jgi:Tol biopolymer transport system component
LFIRLGSIRCSPFSTFTLVLILAASLLCPAAGTRGEELGGFEAQGDIGWVGKAGSALFKAEDRSFLVSGGGDNMWFTNDAFHFVWMRRPGNFALSAAVEWLGTGGNAHRKACLLVRESLRPDSPYVAVAVHGDGLTSLQFRETPGGPTREIQARRVEPARVGLTRQGNVFYLSVPMEGEPPGAGRTATPQLEPAGAFIRLALAEPSYVGLGVCAHDNQVLEQARFVRVELEDETPGLTSGPSPKPVLHCTLETVALASKARQVIYHTTDLIEAPNWSPDGWYLLFNSGGRLYQLPASGGSPEALSTGPGGYCGSDHGFSPDGRRLAITDQSRAGTPLIYTVPVAGGVPHQVTTRGPSYWHGWSPDGSTLAYTAGRNGKIDIYTIPTQGGAERRLTTAAGINDGPDYSPDGKFIYFSSDRTGTMQIWRMSPDGGNQEEVTADKFNNWFPHVSPDGKWVVFLSVSSAKKVPSLAAPTQPCMLRLLPLGGGPVEELARLVGGQGTINAPSWSPDSRELAFVSYEMITPGR